MGTMSLIPIVRNGATLVHLGECFKGELLFERVNAGLPFVSAF
jgi:hypothetical protein